MQCSRTIIRNIIILLLCEVLPTHCRSMYTKSVGYNKLRGHQGRCRCRLKCPQSSQIALLSCYYALYHFYCNWFFNNLHYSKTKKSLRRTQRKRQNYHDACGSIPVLIQVFFFSFSCNQIHKSSQPPNTCRGQKQVESRLMTRMMILWLADSCWAYGTRRPQACHYITSLCVQQDLLDTLTQCWLIAEHGGEFGVFCLVFYSLKYALMEATAWKVPILETSHPLAHIISPLTH